MDDFPGRSPLPSSSHLFGLYVILCSFLTLHCFLFCSNFIFLFFCTQRIFSLVLSDVAQVCRFKGDDLYTGGGFVKTVLFCSFVHLFVHVYMTPASTWYAIGWVDDAPTRPGAERGMTGGDGVPRVFTQPGVTVKGQIQEGGVTTSLELPLRAQCSLG